MGLILHVGTMRKLPRRNDVSQRKIIRARGLGCSTGAASVLYRLLFLAPTVGEPVKPEAAFAPHATTSGQNALIELAASGGRS